MYLFLESVYNFILGKCSVDIWTFRYRDMYLLLVDPKHIRPWWDWRTCAPWCAARWFLPILFCWSGAEMKMEIRRGREIHIN